MQGMDLEPMVNILYRVEGQKPRTAAQETVTLKEKGHERTREPASIPGENSEHKFSERFFYFSILCGYNV